MPDLPMRLVYSVRIPEEVIYADELGDETTLTYTREAPADWTGHTGRIDAEVLAGDAAPGAIAFVCGSNGFVESARRAAARRRASSPTGSAPSASARRADVPRAHAPAGPGGRSGFGFLRASRATLLPGLLRLRPESEASRGRRGRL